MLFCIYDLLLLLLWLYLHIARDIHNSVEKVLNSHSTYIVAIMCFSEYIIILSDRVVTGMFVFETHNYVVFSLRGLMAILGLLTG